LPAATHSVAQTTANSAAKVIAVIAATPRPISSNSSFAVVRSRQSTAVLLPIDGVVSADHVTYDGDADEGHD